jgi:hypothetical protein
MPPTVIKLRDTTSAMRTDQRVCFARRTPVNVLWSDINVGYCELTTSCSLAHISIGWFFNAKHAEGAQSSQSMRLAWTFHPTRFSFPLRPLGNLRALCVEKRTGVFLRWRPEAAPGFQCSARKIS